MRKIFDAKNPFNVGQVVKKVDRPNAPLAKVVSVEGDKLTIEYLDSKEVVETYGVDASGYARYEKPVYPEYKKVIFADPYTIVIWPDDSKTVVKAMKGDDYDEATGLAMCLIKKMYGGAGILKKVVKDVKKASAKALAEAKAKEDAKAKAIADEKAKAEAKAAKEAAEKAAADEEKNLKERLTAALENLAIKKEA